MRHLDQVMSIMDCRVDPLASPHDQSRDVETANLASGLYRLRRRRDRLFSRTSFSEPSWDLLLDLLVAEKLGTRISVTSAHIAAATSMTTAQRCLRQLEALELVYRERDLRDGRRTYVRLSQGALAAMEILLEDFRYRLFNFHDLDQLIHAKSKATSPA